MFLWWLAVQVIEKKKLIDRWASRCWSGTQTKYMKTFPFCSPKRKAEWITSTKETQTVVQLTNQKSMKIFTSCVSDHYVSDTVFY